ncbi:MAG: ester cyclase [Maritimibacter sp.]
MTNDEMKEVYRGYIACLNAQDWAQLDRFVAEEVTHNERPIGLAGYRAMLEADFKAIPDLRFNIDRLLCDPPMIASRLAFDCTPVGQLFGLEVNGKRVRFAENVFYELKGGKICAVWSVIDKASIADQL